MILGKWNRSVILTYIGLAFAVCGIFLAITTTRIDLSYSCLMVAGICDLFDGAVARKVKRNDEEKAFGIELDSLVDAIDFIALPIAIFIQSGLTSPVYIALCILYAICGIARLAHFNAVTADGNGPVKFYTGLPVTYTALIFPLFYLLSLVIPENIFPVIYALVILGVSALEVLKVKVIKPKGAAYIFFGLLAIVMLIVYLVFL